MRQGVVPLPVIRALEVSPEREELASILTNRQMTELLRTLSRKGERGLILITHDLRFVARLAQDAIVLRQGALVEAGEAQDILSRPKTEYTRQLVKSARFAAEGEAEAL